MLKKAIKALGCLFLAIGFISIIPNLNYLLTSRSTTGKVIEILQRKSGFNYEGVDVGGVYPCKLKFSFIDSQGRSREGLTSIETDPCGQNRVGDVVNIRYDLENKLRAERNDFAVWFGFPVVVILFGAGLVIFSGKLPAKKK